MECTHYGMFQTGRVHQVAREMKRLGFAILGVSETRWTGTGKVQLGCSETVLFSGLAGDNAPHQRWVAMILSKEAVKSLKEWEPVSERIITARFESKCQATRVIQVYSPMNDAEEDEKEDFYHQFQTTLNKKKVERPHFAYQRPERQSGFRQHKPGNDHGETR